MIKSIKKIIYVALVLFLSNMPEIAYAACASPAANEGAREYFTATGTYAYCDGTNWLYFSTVTGAACTVEGQWDYDTVNDKYMYCGMTSSGGASGITGLAAGYSTTCALKSDGTAWCWGSNYTGGLGNGLTADSNVPTGVSSATWQSLGANMAAMIFDDGSGLSTFYNSMNCAIDDADETLWCWTGQCNQSACPTSATPAQFDTDTWQSITASDYERDLVGGNNDPQGFVCGIKTDGTGWCWGNDDFGQLGNGGMFLSGFYMSTPSQISTSSVSTWKQLAAAGGFEDSNSFACGIASDDVLWCWGVNDYGQLGIGVIAGWFTEPTLVDTAAGIPDTWKYVAVGSGNSFIVEKVGCAIAMDDTLWCWGTDTYGQLGNGGATTRLSPTAVDTSGSVPDTWKTVETSGITTCAIAMDDTLWCWGNTEHGQVGIGVIGIADILTPYAVSTSGSIPDTWKEVSLGSLHVCAVGSDDTLWCWGDDGFGQLGNGATATDQSIPVQVSGGGTWMSGGSSSSLVWKTINCEGISPCTNLGACANEAQMEYIPGSDLYRLCTGSALNNMKILCGTASYTGFTNLTNESPPAAVETSEIRQVTGLTICPGAISISGSSSPQYRICSDAACSTVVQNWGNTASTISNNQYVQIRQTGSLGATVTATLDIEGITAEWSVYTNCGTPSYSTFTDLTGQVPPAATKTSNIVQVTGLSCATAISVSGVSSAQYRICSDAACSTEVQTWGSTAATISNNQYVQVRLTNATSAGITSSLTLNVSGVTDTWSVTNGTYKIAFVTSTTHTGNLGGISGADSICMTRAAAASLSGNFEAWIAVAAASDPESTFTTSASNYYMPNGTVIANGWTDLIDNTLDSALNVYETGAAAAGATQVWTNVQADATREGPNNNDCSDWTATGGSGNIGLRTSATATWTNDATLSCASSARLYCFEQ